MKLKASECCAECGDAAPRVRKGKKFKLCEDCRAAVTTRRWRVRKAMRSLRNEIGHVVEYNEGEGWRTGYLVEILSVNGRVQPIGACGRVPDIVTVCLADVKIPTCGSPSMPTVADFYRRMESMKPKKVVVLVAQPVVVKCTAGANKGLSAVAAQTDELAGPETGDVSFPYGANAPAPVFVGLDLATKADVAVVREYTKDSIDVLRNMTPVQKTPVSTEREQPKKLNTPRRPAIVVGQPYGIWTPVSKLVHGRFKCVDASGNEQVMDNESINKAAL